MKRLAICATLLVACAHSAPAARRDIPPSAGPLRVLAGVWLCDETIAGASNGQLRLTIAPAINDQWMELEWVGYDDFPIMRGLSRGDELHLFDRGGRYALWTRASPDRLEYRAPSGSTRTFQRDRDKLSVAGSAGGGLTCRLSDAAPRGP